MRGTAGASGAGFLDGWDEHPDHPALITDGHTVTYAELSARVSAESQLCDMARCLVLVELSNTVEAVVSYLAALRAGHVVLVASGADSRDTLVAAYDPDVVIGTDGADGWTVHRRRLTTRHELHPDLALLLSTSGSTGSPKLVRLSHANLDSNARAIAQYLGIDGSDRAMTVLPLSYCYGLSVLHSHLTQGAAVVVTGLSVVDPGFWELARVAGATSFAGVPYTFDLLDSIGFEEVELPSLRYVTQAGGKMGAARVRRFAELGHRRGWDLVVMYGQTEATARMAYLPPERVLDAPEAIGQPIPGGAFTIDGDSELIYHGPNVMLGYATTSRDLALGRTIDCLHTGDLARRRADGLYEIIGRRSRFLKLFGLRVDLDQLEHSLRADGIEALCAGDDARLIVAVTRSTPDPVPVVCTKVGLPATAVQTVVLDELPHNANGKPDYAGVLRLAESRTQGTESAAPAAQNSDVRALYREVLAVDEVADTDTFVSLGGDSLSYVETSRRLDDLLGTLPTHWYLRSVADLEQHARSKQRGLFAWMELSTVLRAVAIVLVCANHVGLTYLFGGAHVLLAVAGHSFARFQLNAVATSGRVRPLIRSIVRIVVPSVIVIAVAYAITRHYDVWNILLIEHLFAPEGPELGPDAWDPVWNYWFIEVLVLALVFCAVLLAIPAVRRVERTWPFGFATGLVAVGLALRFQPFSGDGAMELYRPVATLWLFAIGWAAARATRDRERVLLTVAAVCGAMLPGFSDGDSGRKLVIACGLLLLIWVTRVPVPVGLRRITAILAGASLMIYLTQPLTFFLLEWGRSLLVDQPDARVPRPAPSGVMHDLRLVAATVIALVAGVLAWKAYELVLRHLARLRRDQLHTREHDGVVP